MTITDRPTAQPAGDAGDGPPRPGHPTDALTASRPAHQAPPAAGSPWDRCDRCSSPVDEAQRYCVVCGAHQHRPGDPVSRYFATARRRGAAAAVVAAPAASGRTVPVTVAATLIALLPIAAGIGVLVGRGAGPGGSDAALVEALKAAQTTQLAQPAGGAVAGTTVGADGVAGGAAADGDAEEAPADGAKVDGIQTTTKQAKILADGPQGSARQLEGSKPTAKDVQESKQAVDQINKRKGDDYIKTQRDLPDTIVIP